MSSFDRKTAIIKLLKTNPGKKFTSNEIATWLVNTYPEEAARKRRTSKNKILCSITDEVMRKKFIISLYSGECTFSFRTALQKIESRIKITEERNPKYCYIGKLVNYEFTTHEEFDLKSTVIRFLKDNPSKEFTSSQIVTWLVNNYPKEVEQEEQASNDRRLLEAKSKVQKRKIVVVIYRSKLNKQFRIDLQKIEPKIRIVKKGLRFRYCYTNNANKVIHKEFDLKSIIINFLKNNSGREFSSSQIAKWLVNNYPKETERKLQISNNKLLISETESKIKIIKKGRWIKYCYVNDTDKIINYDETYHKKIDRKTAVIDFLKAHSGKEFTHSQIATWLVDTYPKEVEKKLQVSNDKRLLNVKNKVERRRIMIMMYRHELNRLLRPTIQKIEPKIKIIKRGCWVRYCYVNDADKIFDKFKIIEILKNYKQQKFTITEMNQLLSNS